MFKIQTPLNISGLKDSRTPEHLVLLEMSSLFIVLVVLLFRGLSTSTGIIELFPKQWAAIWEKTSEIYLMIIADNNQHWPFHAAFSRHTNDRVGFLNHGQFAPCLVLEVLPKADIWFLSGQRADGLPVSSLFYHFDFVSRQHPNFSSPAKVVSSFPLCIHYHSLLRLCCLVCMHFVLCL